MSYLYKMYDFILVYDGGNPEINLIQVKITLKWAS